MYVNRLAGEELTKKLTKCDIEGRGLGQRVVSLLV